MPLPAPAAGEAKCLQAGNPTDGAASLRPSHKAWRPHSARLEPSNFKEPPPSMRENQLKDPKFVNARRVLPRTLKLLHRIADATARKT